jgi:hypothetical protein
MLRLSAYTLYTPSLLCNIDSRLAIIIVRQIIIIIAMRNVSLSLQPFGELFPISPRLLLALYYPIPALVRTSPPCAVASCHSRGRAKYHPPGDRFIIYLYNKTSYNNTTFLFSTFKGRPHQPVS